MSYLTLDLCPASIQRRGGQQRPPRVELPPNPVYREALHYVLFSGAMTLYSSWAGSLWLEVFSMLALICLPMGLLSRDVSHHSRTLQTGCNENAVHLHFTPGLEQLIRWQDTRMTRLPEPLPAPKVRVSDHRPPACFSRGLNELQTRCKGFDVALRGYP